MLNVFRDRINQMTKVWKIFYFCGLNIMKIYPHLNLNPELLNI